MSARIGAPLAVLAVAAGWAWLSRDLPLGGPEGPGPRFVPLLTAGLLGLLGLVLAVEAARGRLVDARAAAPGWGQAARVLGLLAVYVAGLAWLGYFEATLPFVALAMWLGGARSPLLVGAAAAGLALAVWLVLGALFGVPLPRGPWL